MSYETIITSNGQAALANAIANHSPLTLDLFQIGDGNGDVVTPQPTATSLVNARYSGTPSNFSIQPGVSNQVAVECVVPANSGGYIVREVGLFSNNVLVCYGALPEIEKPLLENGAVGDLVLTVYLTISDTSAITLSVDSASVMATRQYVDIADERYNAIIRERDIELRKQLAYYDGLHISERLSRLRTIETAPTGMKFNGVAMGKVDGDYYVCLSYADQYEQDGGMSVCQLSATGFEPVFWGRPIHGVCFGDECFVAGTTGGIYYADSSPWGWNFFSLPTNHVINKVVYNGRHFFAITDEALYKIAKDTNGITAEEVWCYDTRPNDIAVNPYTGAVYLVGFNDDDYDSFVEIDANGVMYTSSSGCRPSHVFYSEPCQRVIVWGNGGAKGRTTDGIWTNIFPGGVLGGGVNVLYYSQFVGSATGSTTMAYFPLTLRRTLDGLDTSTTDQCIYDSTTAQRQLYIFNGLLFALTRGKLETE